MASNVWGQKRRQEVSQLIVLTIFEPWDAAVIGSLKALENYTIGKFETKLVTG